MRSRGAVLLALAAVGALVAVIANAFLSHPAAGTAADTGFTDAGVLAAETAGPDTAALERSAPGIRYAPGAHDRAGRPKLTARAFVAFDADTRTVLLAGGEQRELPIASLTKVMTGLLVIERGELGRKVRVPRQATRVEANREGLRAGRWYSRRLLLYSALMVSANDSATALAYDAGGGSLARFYRMMNARARELGLAHTVYHSPSGLDDETNRSTALDQAVLARAALENPVFARIVRTRRKVVEWPPPTYAKEWVNHNRMLVTYPGTYGVKTGYTSAAGGCLVVAVARGGHHVIGVVLHSRNIWVDMPRLMDAAFRRLRAA
jgi:D-alanyl-D-alanine carboxypeptidase